MGLTKSSTGRASAEGTTLSLREGERLIALAGCPNVGKSTLFNHLTGLRQHTGNWSGKTVGCTYGRATYKNESFVFADIPGTYSLASRSAEESLARDFIAFGGAEFTVLVCDAGCLSRGLSLALQAMEAHNRVIICVNLLDEAKRQGLEPRLKPLSAALGVPVIGMCAAKGEGVSELLATLAKGGKPHENTLSYPRDVERGIEKTLSILGDCVPKPCSRYVALSLLRGDTSAANGIAESLKISPSRLQLASEEGRACLENAAELEDIIAETLSNRAAELSRLACEKEAERSRGVDRILTHPLLGIPAMGLLLAAVLWLTIKGANAPSAWLSSALFALGDWLESLSGFMPLWMRDALFSGIWRTAAWVTAVMLPPMAIFFPLFTLLEDVGYLPRVAFNLDGYFQKAHACGKQGLTMCMGFGCNAAGVVGCRIIDSPRERMIAMLTNAFVPCNGRFPALIAVITIFFATNSAVGAIMLSGLIVLGVALTFLYSRILSATVLRGMQSSFTLELPPYRRANPARILVRSLLDRTIFVLGRAVAVAAPAGLLIWALGKLGLIAPLASMLDPFGHFIGLNGVILLAFILALPANEIVIPIILMCAMSQASLVEYSSLAELSIILKSVGWTEKTALCFLIFNLLHSPCSTTLLTIKRESGKWRWAALAALLPTSAGVIICAVINFLF